jgi:hypothetical protein
VYVVRRTVLKQFLSGIMLFAEKSGVLIYVILSRWENSAYAGRIEGLN